MSLSRPKLTRTDRDYQLVPDQHPDQVEGRRVGKLAAYGRQRDQDDARRRGPTWSPRASCSSARSTCIESLTATSAQLEFAYKRCPGVPERHLDALRENLIRPELGHGPDSLKLAVYGPQARLGLVIGDKVVDLQRAAAACLSSQEEAEARVGHTFRAFLEGGEGALKTARQVLRFAKRGPRRPHEGQREREDRVPHWAVQSCSRPSRTASKFKIMCIGANFADHFVGLSRNSPASMGEREEGAHPGGGEGPGAEQPAVGLLQDGEQRQQPRGGRPVSLEDEAPRLRGGGRPDNREARQGHQARGTCSSTSSATLSSTTSPCGTTWTRAC